MTKKKGKAEKATKNTYPGNNHFTFSWRDLLITAALYLASVMLCLLLRQFDPHNDSSYVAMIFLLDAYLTATFTEGYFFSILMAVFGVLSVDYIFTPPYWHISFTVAGFPLTFLVMLTISLATATVTTRAKRVDALERQAEKERMHANLLRAISHDLRTPLTGIAGATDVMLEREDLMPEQRRELLQNVNEEAQWLIRMVENLLSVTRIGGEETALVKTPCPAEEVVEGAVAKFHKRYPDIPVQVSLPEQVTMIPMDELLIQQVLLNLLENAAIHGKDLTKIRVSLICEDGWARFVVEDDGRGISVEQLPNLFNGSAQQMERGDSRRNMGIGLSVCRTIVEAHGGNIQGKNRLPRGARLIVTLPLQEEEEQ